MWRRVVGAAVVLVLALITGVFPGSSTRATVDYCYVRPGDWMPDETKCTGHWSSAGLTFTGRMHGVHPDEPGWRATTSRAPGSRPEDGQQMAPPAYAREYPAVGMPGTALVYPALVWLIRLVALVVVSLLVLVLAGGVRGRWYLRAYERRLQGR
jgi:hypothetical protein